MINQKYSRNANGGGSASNPNDAIQIEWQNKRAQIANCIDPDLSNLAQCAFGAFGAADAEPSVLVMGDSWSDHYVMMVDYMLKDANKAGYQLTAGGNLPFLANKNKVNEINFAAIEAGQYDYVVMGNSLPRYYNEAFSNQLWETVDFIVANEAAPVFIIGLYDRYRNHTQDHGDYDYTRCGFTIFSDCEFEDDTLTDNSELAVREILQSIQEKYPQTVIIDLHDFLCTDGKCSALIDGYPLYLDTSGHITPYASHHLGEMYLETHINPLKN
ncbi:MAG: hypothetical protein LBV04_08310 [Deferribacteraceae bacterium]|jgi:hypothetical protein|nr:hypothetical protein [Deferribacteraceae bacterium]